MRDVVDPRDDAERLTATRDVSQPIRQADIVIGGDDVEDDPADDSSAGERAGSLATGQVVTQDGDHHNEPTENAGGDEAHEEADDRSAQAGGTPPQQPPTGSGRLGSPDEEPGDEGGGDDQEPPGQPKPFDVTDLIPRQREPMDPLRDRTAPQQRTPEDPLAFPDEATPSTEPAEATEPTKAAAGQAETPSPAVTLAPGTAIHSEDGEILPGGYAETYNPRRPHELRVETNGFVAARGEHPEGEDPVLRATTAGDRRVVAVFNPITHEGSVASIGPEDVGSVGRVPISLDAVPSLVHPATRAQVLGEVELSEWGPQVAQDWHNKIADRLRDAGIADVTTTAIGRRQEIILDTRTGLVVPVERPATTPGQWPPEVEFERHELFLDAVATVSPNMRMDVGANATESSMRVELAERGIARIEEQFRAYMADPNLPKDSCEDRAIALNNMLGHPTSGVDELALMIERDHPILESLRDGHGGERYARDLLANRLGWRINYLQSELQDLYDRDPQASLTEGEVELERGLLARIDRLNKARLDIRRLETWPEE